MTRPAARKTKKYGEGRIGEGLALRVKPGASLKKRDRTATHLMPSGLGGVFKVEMLHQEGDCSVVRSTCPARIGTIGMVKSAFAWQN